MAEHADALHAEFNICKHLFCQEYSSTDLQVDKGNYLPFKGVKAGCQCGKTKHWIEFAVLIRL